MYFKYNIFDVNSNLFGFKIVAVIYLGYQLQITLISNI